MGRLSDMMDWFKVRPCFSKNRAWSSWQGRLPSDPVALSSRRSRRSVSVTARRLLWRGFWAWGVDGRKTGMLGPLEACSKDRTGVYSWTILQRHHRFLGQMLKTEIRANIVILDKKQSFRAGEIVTSRISSLSELLQPRWTGITRI